ncbi:MAG: response regulator [Patescibacteria group bacterium]
MSFKKILIIEDNQNHLEEVRRFIDGRVKAGADFEAHFVSTFDDAKKALDTEQYDGIISDIFFPDREGGSPDPVTPAPRDNQEEQLNWAEGVGGVKLVREARSRRIPFMLCTSTYHHGQKTQPVSTWLRANNVEFIVDASYEVAEGEAEHKNWQSAFIKLAYIRSLIDHKLFEMSESGTVESEGRLGGLNKKDPIKYQEMEPLIDISNRNSPNHSSSEAASEVADGIANGKLHTMDPILMEVLDGPGRGLVSYTSEVPTTAELLERAKNERYFREVDSKGLRVQAYNKEERRKCTEEEIEERTHQAVERFITNWKERKPKVEQAWRKWLEWSIEGIEGIEKELPQERLASPKDWL